MRFARPAQIRPCQGCESWLATPAGSNARKAHEQNIGGVITNTGYISDGTGILARKGRSMHYFRTITLVMEREQRTAASCWICSAMRSSVLA